MEEAVATVGVWFGVGMVGYSSSAIATIAVAFLAVVATLIIW